MNELSQRERYLLAYGLSGLIIFGGFMALLLGRIDVRDLVTLIAMAGGFVGLSLMPGATRANVIPLLLVLLIGGCKATGNLDVQFEPAAQFCPSVGYSTEYLILSERASNPLPALGKPGIYVPTGGYPQLVKADGTTLDPAAIPAPNIANGSVSNAEFQTLDGSNTGTTIQAQLDGKQAALTLPLSIANGGRNDGTALNNNRPMVSSGGKIIETASACGSGKVLLGGSPPDCGSIASAMVWYGLDYGDGSDGAATITGGTTTLAANKNYTDLTVTGTGVLYVANWDVAVSGTLTVQAGGKIHCNGNAASGATAGAARAAGQYPASGAGGAGGTGAGSNGGSLTSSLGGAGGNGGYGLNGVNSGGTGGAATASTSPRTLEYWKTGLGWPANSTTPALATPGAGGASGGGDAPNSGGGGGGGGCRVNIRARHATIAGTIEANGGAGGNGTGGVGATSGGGGGGGGGEVIVYGPDTTVTGTVQANGGAGGVGPGGCAAMFTCADGSAGSSGTTKIATPS